MAMADLIVGVVAQFAAKEVIQEGLQTALDTMQSMIGNEGQQSVYDKYVVPEFKLHAKYPIEDGWQEVDIGPYMDFMGEIVGEGNSIMDDTFNQAQQILDEAQLV